jgi:epoxyqueuosine reductase
VSAPSITAELLAELAELAAAHGLLGLSAVRLDHPGFEPARAALHAYLDEGRHGEMAFMARTREVRADPGAMLPGAACLLVALVPYDGDDGPIARYARAADYHTVMHARFAIVQARLAERLPGVRTLVCVDTKPVLERAAAALSGLGFIGKNGMLIAPGLGSYVLLGGILCTAELRVPDAVDNLRGLRWDACGTCTRCLDACPTAAFDAPGRLDPRRCISYLTIEHRGPIPDALADGMGERIAGCDVCQEVCPYNAGRGRSERIPEAARLPEAGGRALAMGDLAELATIGSAGYRAFVRGTALRRIPRAPMRRNVLIAIGNRAGRLTEAERDVLDRATQDDDPQVRAAAERALTRRSS